MKHFDDLTKIDVPISELDEDTKDRLKLCRFFDVGSSLFAGGANPEDKWLVNIELYPGSKFMERDGTCIFRKSTPRKMTRKEVLENLNVDVTD